MPSLVVSDSKESACNAEDQGSIPGSERSPGEGNGNPLQYSCLRNSMERGAWRATVHGVTKVRYDLATKQQQQQPIFFPGKSHGQRRLVDYSP